MGTFKFLLFYLFLSLTISLVAFAQTAEYEYKFTFSDELNNSQDLILGKDPFGTDGMDTLFGEEFIPQVPPGEFGVRFQIPPDTSITTIKDIRFGCYWATGHEHLIDLNYQTGSSSISVVWEWGIWDLNGLDWVMFINPFNGQTFASFNWSPDTSFFTIPSSLAKIEIWTGYGGTLSTVEYELYTPNGGEILEGGNIYEITWWSNQLAPWLDIEFSTDFGTTWNLIADSVWTTNSGYNWQVPNISSENCLIRLGNYPCNYDLSDSVFKITYPVSTEEEKTLPTQFSLEQNYPNPFNPSTKIQFSLPQTTFVTLEVFNLLGKSVGVLVSEELNAGTYNHNWDATTLTSGIYFYKLQAGNFVQTKKMILMK